MAEKMQLAAWSDESLEQSDGTYRVAMCEADKPGYWTLDHIAATLDEAKAIAEAFNAGRGLTATQVIDIRTSSMAAHMAGWRAADDAILEGTDER